MDPGAYQKGQNTMAEKTAYIMATVTRKPLARYAPGNEQPRIYTVSFDPGSNIAVFKTQDNHNSIVAAQVFEHVPVINRDDLIVVYNETLPGQNTGKYYRFPVGAQYIERID